MPTDKNTFLKGKTENYYNHFRKLQRKCMVEGCGKLTANNHILQKNGIISKIKDSNQNVMALSFSLFEEKYFYFKEFPYTDKRLYTFEGFCGEHDTEIFLPIERKVLPNLNDYQVQVRFSLRAILNMLRNIQINNDVNTKLSREKPIEDTFIESQSILQNFILLKPWIEQVQQMKFDLEESRSRNFIFYTVDLPKLDICSSQAHVFEDKNMSTANSIHLLDPILSLMFVNILTFENKYVLIIGYHKSVKEICGPYIDELVNRYTKVQLILLSDILLSPSNQYLPPST